MSIIRFIYAWLRYVWRWHIMDERTGPEFQLAALQRQRREAWQRRIGGQ